MFTSELSQINHLDYGVQFAIIEKQRKILLSKELEDFSIV